MTELRTAIEQYLAVRRSLGYGLVAAERLLGQFCAHCEALGTRQITVELALGWATQPAGASLGWQGQRLSVVRGFAAWLQTIDPATEIPPADLLPYRPRRAVPYLYTEAEVAALMAVARRLPFALQALNYEHLIGLLAATGLRIAEAIRLDRDDVDFDAGLLRVIGSKWGKSRHVPLHASVSEALRRYARERDQLCPVPSTASFFVSTVGTRPSYPQVSATFKRLTREAGLEPRSPRCRPTLHSLRHSFAVRALVDAYRGSGDVHALLPLLATYLGHAGPNEAYWYLTATPELTALVGSRLERVFEGDGEARS
jgi:integrase/recombinase XerD